MEVSAGPFADLLRDRVVKCKQARKGKTNKSIALDAGISPETLSRYIGGDPTPEDLAEACNSERDELVNAWRKQQLHRSLASMQQVLSGAYQFIHRTKHDLDLVRLGLPQELAEARFNDRESLGELLEGIVQQAEALEKQLPIPTDDTGDWEFIPDLVPVRPIDVIGRLEEIGALDATDATEIRMCRASLLASMTPRRELQDALAIQLGTSPDVLTRLVSLLKGLQTSLRQDQSEIADRQERD